MLNEKLQIFDLREKDTISKIPYFYFFQYGILFANMVNKNLWPEGVGEGGFKFPYLRILYDIHESAYSCTYCTKYFKSALYCKLYAQAFL